MHLKRSLILSILTAFLAVGAAAASEPLLGLRTRVDAQATSFLLQVPEPVDFSPSRITPRLYTVDLAGVSTDRSSEPQLVQSPLVSSYRLLNYPGAAGEPRLRLEILLKDGNAEITTEQGVDGLEIRILSADASPSMPPAAVADNDNTAVDANANGGTAPGKYIREVSVVRTEAGPLEVEIVSDGALRYRTMQLRNPERLVVDIPGAVNLVRQKNLPVNYPPLRAVRIGQFSRNPLVSRVVLDLDSRIPFHIEPQSNTLVVSLNEDGPTIASEIETNGGVPAADESAEATASVEDAADAAEAVEEAMADSEPSSLDAVREEEAAEEETVPVEMAASAEPEPVLLASNQPPVAVSPTMPSAGMSAGALSIEPPQQPQTVALPLEASPEAAELPGEPVSETSQEVVPAMEEAPETEPAEQPSYAAASLEPPILLAQQTLPAAAAGMAQVAPGAAQPIYTGEPISVNLKDVDLKDFFRLIHEISGLNIVLDPNVSGVVTIILDEVPWDQAMEIVMKNNQLGKEVEGTVVRLASLSTLQKEEEQRRDLALAIEQAQPKVTVTRTLSYSRAADMIATLKRFLSPRGDLIADARTNTLIVTDIPDVITQLDGLIQALDKKSLQVEIEARVVAASRSFARDIGAQLAASGLTGNVVLGGTGLVGVSQITRGSVPPLFIGQPPDDPLEFANVSQPLLTNLGAVGPTSGFSFLHTSPSGNFALDAIITAAESRGVGKLLSRPRVITQNNVEAMVKQGVRIPVQTTVNNTVSVQFVDVVLRLTVTPQITADGTIFLKTDVENTSIDPGIARIQGIPALDTQQATTQVLVSNGGTVFFGGVIQNINNLTEQQVPLLGSIPLLGNLFKRKATSSTTNELLFFITPRIVPS